MEGSAEFTSSITGPRRALASEIRRLPDKVGQGACRKGNVLRSPSAAESTKRACGATGGDPPADAEQDRSRGSFAAVASTAKGTFEIAMTPSAPEISGAVGRLDFAKTWRGDLEGMGSGVLLSCGDPQAGEAGYVAIETIEGRLGDRDGGFTLQQLGSMHGGSPTLHYNVSPGSGRGAPGSPARCSSPSTTMARTDTNPSTTSNQLWEPRNGIVLGRRLSRLARPPGAG